jgi:hypothetical protein
LASSARKFACSEPKNLRKNILIIQPDFESSLKQELCEEHVTFLRGAVKLSGLNNDRKHLFCFRIFYVFTPDSKSEINLGQSRNATKLLAILISLGHARVRYFIPNELVVLACRYFKNTIGGMFC